MICSKCGAENPTGLKFCEQCATPLKKRCTQCGFENSAAARFCGECAAPLKIAALTTQPEATPSVRLSALRSRTSAAQSGDQSALIRAAQSGRSESAKEEEAVIDASSGRP